MLKVSRHRDCLHFKSDDYEVFNVEPKDYYCDLHILACTPDEEEQLLIPIDKNLVMKNLTYFELMFSENSNWEESKGNLSGSGDGSGKFPTEMIKIHVPKPKLLGEYFKSLYNDELSITEENCADLHQISDFLRDEEMLK